jgi:hypothetical protein
MPLPATRTAIGATSTLLREQLTARTGVNTVDVGRPEASAGAAGPKLNLFLYQIELDGHLRNHPLDAGQKTPLWLVLRYLLTAIDDNRESDSTGAHDLLGEGMLALQELNVLRPSVAALIDNPEPLKITFDQADAELLSKIMQGNDERYRLSAAFQIRPIMIAPADVPDYAPLVTSVGPPADEGVLVLPSLGPRLDEIEPERFEAGDTVTVSGQDLGDAQTLCFGDVCYPVTAAPAGKLRATVPADTELSAGSYPVVAVKPLPSGRRLGSNALLGRLSPTLLSAAPSGLADNAAGHVFGDLQLAGRRLGGPDDGIFVGFYAQGRVQRLVEAAGSAAQTALTVTVDSDAALPPGDYRIILRVNGEQAANTPEVDWS